jgi:TatD DNase family protein
MIIDTHCHLNFRDFKDDHLDVIQRALDNNMCMIIVGSELRTSQRAVDLSEKFSRGVYSSVGLHPIHLQSALIKNKSEEGDYMFKSRGEDFIEENYQRLIDFSDKIVAIGETGLDYYHIEADSKEKKEDIKKLQEIFFRKQLNLAHKNNLPVIIHCREAHDDLYPILKDFYEKNKKKEKKDWGVIHCFSGDYNLAEKYFALGLKISFTGLITFVDKWDEVIQKAPIDKMMVETDAPYLAPVPYRGKRNEPLYTKKVLEKISEIRGEDYEKIEEEIFKISLDFFDIKF